MTDQEQNWNVPLRLKFIHEFLTEKRDQNPGMSLTTHMIANPRAQTAMYPRCWWGDSSHRQVTLKNILTILMSNGNRDSRLWVRLVTWVKRKKPDAKKAPHIKKDSKPLAKAKPTRAPRRPTPDSRARVMPALVLRKLGSHVRPKTGILRYLKVIWNHSIKNEHAKLFQRVWIPSRRVHLALPTKLPQAVTVAPTAWAGAV